MVTVIVDLRTDEERIKKQCPLITDKRFTYCIYTINGGNKVPETIDEVANSYIGMVDDTFDNLIDFLMNTESNVLYFCNAGKDRTGVVSAALLYKLGVSRNYIIDDYMKSKSNLKIVLDEYARNNPGIDIEIITPDERHISAFLNWYDDR